jgi:hypothetical protein
VASSSVASSSSSSSSSSGSGSGSGSGGGGGWAIRIPLPMREVRATSAESVTKGERCPGSNPCRRRGRGSGGSTGVAGVLETGAAGVDFGASGFGFWSPELELDPVGAWNFGAVLSTKNHPHEIVGWQRQVFRRKKEFDNLLCW